MCPAHFTPDGGHHNTLRLSFSGSAQRIHEGMGKLRELFLAHLG